MQTAQLHQLFLESTGVSTDTRKVKSGELFFALKGANFDGNIYAEKAIESGAAYAIVDDASVVKNNQYILVDNVLEALQNLAAFHRKKIQGEVIALTGSNGKTSTKELIYAVLSQKYKTVCTQGNLNNHIGVPLTILSAPLNTEFLIVEMGANHQGEIASYCTWATPDFGLITNIGKAHLEGFGGVEGIIKGKTELYTSIKNSNGMLFVHADDVLLMEKSEGIHRKTYSIENKADYTGKLTTEFPFLELDFSHNEDIFHISSQLLGKYNVPNIMVAASIGRYFFVSNEQISKGIQEYIPDNNRSQILKKGTTTIILDAYNANPSSMRVALDNLAAQKATKKVAILGDMKELGIYSFKEHTDIVNYAHSLGFNEIVLVGPEMKLLNQKEYPCFDSYQEAKAWYISQDFSDTLILIKGSRGVSLEKILD